MKWLCGALVAVATALFAVAAAVALILTVVGGEASGIVGGQQACEVRAAAGAVNQAALTVKFENGRTQTYCIEFAEESITGLELLRRSGLPVVTALSGGQGTAVCSIDGEGCNDPGDCFCKCRGGTCAYWAYFREQDGAWQYSSLGAGLRTIRNGDADAWVWGNGNSSPGGASVDCELQETATPEPSSTPRPPTATQTPRATRTPTPVAASPVPVTATASVIAAQPSPSPPPVSVPTSDVLGAAVTPQPGMPTATAASASSVTPRPGSPSPSPSASPTTTATPGSGVVRVTDAEGDQNQAASTQGGGWNWTSTIVFAGFAAMLAAVGGGTMYWRRRAGS